MCLVWSTVVLAEQARQAPFVHPMPCQARDVAQLDACMVASMRRREAIRLLLPTLSLSLELADGHISFSLSLSWSFFGDRSRERLRWVELSRLIRDENLRRQEEIAAARGVVEGTRASALSQNADRQRVLEWAVTLIRAREELRIWQGSWP